MLLRTVVQDETTHALETRPLPRLRTPLLVLRRWPSAGEVESGITTCTDVIGVRNRRLVNACLRVVYGEAGMLEILPDDVPISRISTPLSPAQVRYRARTARRW